MHILISKKVYLLSLVFLLLAQFTIAQEAGEDQTICTNGEAKLGQSGGDPDACYSWKPDDGSLDDVTSPQPTATPGSTTTYTLTITGKDFSYKKTDDVKVVVINDIKLKEVSFSATAGDIVKDDNSQTYSAPQWKDGQTPSPVCYVAGGTLTVAVKIELDDTPTSNAKIKVRGKGTNGYDIDETTASAGGTTVNLAATASKKPFDANKVDFYDPFEITWEISFDDGKTWCDAGKSSNRLYVLWQTPVLSAPTTLFHTTVHLSCMNAKGQTSEGAIFNSIWGEFTDRSVSRMDGKQMTYYGNWTNVNTSAASLLLNGDGQCGSWASLLLDMLKIHGITSHNYVLVDYSSSGGFLVKNWTFTGAGTSGDPTYPYFNLPDPPLITPTAYTWKYAEVNDAVGIPGQGTANPASLFNNHQFIKYGGKYYDPSYGIVSNTIADVDQNALDAFFEVKPAIISEAAINKDLNGDGDKADTFTLNTFFIKKNPPGNDLNEHLYSY